MTSVPHGVHCPSHLNPPFFPYQSSIRYFTPPPLCPDALLHISSPFFHLFLPLLHFTSHISLHSLLFNSFSFTLPSPCPPHPPYTLFPLFYLSKFFHVLYHSLLLLLPVSPSLLLFLHIQKPHGGSASNLNVLGSPFVLLVQGPHNAVSSAQDPLRADLIR